MLPLQFCFDCSGTIRTLLCSNDPFDISGYTHSYSSYKFAADFVGLFNLDFYFLSFCIIGITL